MVQYDPRKIRDIEFDLSIVESSATPVFREQSKEILLELWRANAITVKQLLKHGNFPFADELLQDISSRENQLEHDKTPDGISPELVQQVQQGANMSAVVKAQQMLQSA